MINCIHCSKQTKNPKFCSRKCSATYSNIHFPKRKPEGKCQYCNKSISARFKNCKDCWINNEKCVLPINVPLKEVIYTVHHKSSAFALVRSRARTIAKKLGWNKCMNCGYSKHIQIVHKKAIHEFDLNTPLNVINQEDNLAPLCPNCHWEYDHGLLDLKS